jgi:formyl-CoA transferase
VDHRLPKVLARQAQVSLRVSVHVRLEVVGLLRLRQLLDPRRQAVEAWCAERSVAEIEKTLLAAEIPVAPVRTIPEVARDPHLWEREMLLKMEDAIAGEIHLPGATIKMSKTPGRIGPVPTPGQHTDEILTRLLGYERAKIEELRREKVVA